MKTQLVIILVLILYVSNIFLNRRLNKIMYKKYHWEIIPFAWFMSLACTIILVVGFFDEKGVFKKFTGKNW